MSRRRILLLAALATAALLAAHNVPAGHTADDIAYTDRILEAAGYGGPKRGFGDLSSFESQVRAIAGVQDAVIRAAPEDVAIPFDTPREPKDVFEQRRGECFDRSRAIEKLLTVMGFEVRHIAVYETTERGALRAILTPGNGSHALTEVRTAKGWMLVDPNVRWVGLTAAGDPVSADGMRSIGMAGAQWNAAANAAPHAIFSTPYTYVIGLYSRHGRFYPPFTPVPDVNWRQLLDNFTG